MYPDGVKTLHKARPMTPHPDLSNSNLIALPLSNCIARIGMVLDQPFPPDARVEREAMALIEAGFEVHILCVLRPEDDVREFVHKGIHVHRVIPEAVDFLFPFTRIGTRLPYKGLIKNVFRHYWNIDTVWHTLIRRFAVRFNLDALHVHDLRLLSTALSVGKKHDIRVISDLHENYPALMEMMKGRTNPDRGEKQRLKWDEIQARDTQLAEAVITVSNEMKDILQKQGLPAEKVTVLPNTVDIEKFLAYDVDHSLVKRFHSRFLLTYIGHVNNHHRGIHTVIEALSILKDEIPDIFFVAAGAYRDHYMEELAAQIDALGVTGHVHFTGWLDESQFRTYIEASDICLCPHIANDQTNTGIPNKVYLYHLFNRPIIASDFTPMKRYIEDTQGGLLYHSGDALELADAIRQLYHDAPRRKVMAERGELAVKERYNWQVTRQSLIGLYQRLFESPFTIEKTKETKTPALAKSST